MKLGGLVGWFFFKASLKKQRRNKRTSFLSLHRPNRQKSRPNRPGSQHGPPKAGSTPHHLPGGRNSFQRTNGQQRSMPSVPRDTGTRVRPLRSKRGKDGSKEPAGNPRRRPTRAPRRPLVASPPHCFNVPGCSPGNLLAISLSTNFSGNKSFPFGACF